MTKKFQKHNSNKLLKFAIRNHFDLNHTKGTDSGSVDGDNRSTSSGSSVYEAIKCLPEEGVPLCVVCGQFQPQKVLGIYTYTKRSNLDDFELKQRKSLGYSTVTHFNVVHVGCHMHTVLSKANPWQWVATQTQFRANSVLPISSQVLGPAFVSALARHNNNLQDCTGYPDVSSTSYVSTIHDLKLLVLRLASGDCLSPTNSRLVPHIVFIGIHHISTESVDGYVHQINSFLEMPSNKWIENCFEAESPYYWCSMSLVIFGHKLWNENRLKFLQRLVICAHVRHLSPQGANTMTDTTVQEFNVYKTSLIFFAFIDSFYKQVFKDVKDDLLSEVLWPKTLALYIQSNYKPLLESCLTISELSESNSRNISSNEEFIEFCDVLGLLNDIPEPNVYLEKTFKPFRKERSLLKRLTKLLH